MTLRYFYIGALGVIALVCVYCNSAMTRGVIAANARAIEALAKKNPSARQLHWLQGNLVSSVLPTTLYGVALGCGVLALYLYNLPPIEHPH